MSASRSCLSLGVFSLSLFLLATEPLEAGSMEFLIGPPSLGQGGSNPLSVPPLNPLDWQISYVNDAQREMVFSLIPGISYGQRFYLKQIYAALGGGVLFTTGGLGVGVHQAIGIQSNDILKNLKIQLEYRQVIGIANYGPQFPYSLRIGLSYAF